MKPTRRDKRRTVIWFSFKIPYEMNLVSGVRVDIVHVMTITSTLLTSLDLKRYTRVEDLYRFDAPNGPRTNKNKQNLGRGE